MATIVPIAYNTGASIPGTTQLGDLAIGDTAQDYGAFPNGVRFWATPDLDTSYAIAIPVPSGNQPNPLSIPCYVGFYKCDKTDGDFISIVEYISVQDGSPQTFASVSEATTWLDSQGYWSSYEGGGVTTGDYQLLSAYTPASSNGSITFPNHNGTTYSLDPNLVGTSGFALYINQNDLLGNNQSSVLNNIVGNSGTLTLTQGGNSVTYSFTNTAFGFGLTPIQYFWDNTYESSPLGGITLISPASGNFNTTTPITITVTN